MKAPRANAPGAAKAPAPARARAGALPKAVVAAAGVAALFVLAPVAGLAARAPWSDLPSVLTRATTGRALAVSLVVSLSAAGLCLLAGVPLGLVLARARFPGRGVLRALVVLPLVAPPVVAGVALLAAFERSGVAGRVLARFGVSLPFTTAGAVVAAAFVAMPLVIVAVESGLRSRGRDLEEAAATLGASPWLTLRSVTLPLLWPQVAAGFAIAWARALGEFGATITFAGNVPGKTQTLPLVVYEMLRTDRDGAIMLSVLLLGVSVTTLVALRDRLFPS